MYQQLHHYKNSEDSVPRIFILEKIGKVTAVNMKKQYGKEKQKTN
jgi:hypothetical protein